MQKLVPQHAMTTTEQRRTFKANGIVTIGRITWHNAFDGTSSPLLYELLAATRHRTQRDRMRLPIFEFFFFFIRSIKRSGDNIWIIVFVTSIYKCTDVGAFLRSPGNSNSSILVFILKWLCGCSPVAAIFSCRIGAVASNEIMSFFARWYDLFMPLWCALSE